jgi:glycerol-3-phosphate dehydrogenase
VVVNATGADVFEPPFQSVSSHGDRPHFVRGVNLILPYRISEYAAAVSVAGEQIEGHSTNRLLFFTPWKDATLVGTWYFPDRRELGNAITKHEFAVCLRDISNRFQGMDVTESQVSHVHVGRLPAATRLHSGQPKLLERYSLIDSQADQDTGGLLTVVSIKYTTARLVAEQITNDILQRLGRRTESKVQATRLYGGEIDDFDRFAAEKRKQYAKRFKAKVIDNLTTYYGTHIDRLASLASENTKLAELVPGCEDVLAAQIQYGLDKEKAQTLSDMLLRRTDLGSLGRPPQSTIDYCVARMAAHYEWDESRRERETQALESEYERIIDA